MAEAVTVTVAFPSVEELLTAFRTKVAEVLPAAIVTEVFASVALELPPLNVTVKLEAGALLAVTVPVAVPPFSEMFAGEKLTPNVGVAGKSSLVIFTTAVPFV